MSTTQPIRSAEELTKIKHYYSGGSLLEQRNRLLIVMGLNTALRISDILKLQWHCVYDFDNCRLKSHIELTEQKTGKQTMIAINNVLKDILLEWKECKEPGADTFIFESTRGSHPIDRHQAYRIISKAAADCGLSEHISCHSLRKTFGYHAWKLGVAPAVLMSIYNHSSYRITMRYLCIDQDDKDSVFAQVQL